MKKLDKVSAVFNIILGVTYIPLSLFSWLLQMASESTIDATKEGRNYIRVWVKGEFEFDFASVASTDLGKHVIVGADDHTIALATEVTASSTYATAYNLIVGKIVKTDTTAKTVRVVLGL